MEGNGRRKMKGYGRMGGGGGGGGALEVNGRPLDEIELGRL